MLSRLAAGLALAAGPATPLRGKSMKSPSGSRVAVPVTGLQVFWALSALAGLVGVGWPALHAPDAARFLAELQQSWSALTVSADLVLLGVPLIVFAVVEARRLGLPMPWIWAPLAIPLPGAFVIPLFLLIRERALARARLRAG